MKDVKQNVNVRTYLNMFLRRKWFFIIPLVVLYLSFAVSGYFLPKVYEARAVILIQEKKVVNPLLKNLVVSTIIAERLNALKEEILAWPRLFQLVEKLGLSKDITHPLELEGLIVKIRKNITLQMMSKEIVVVSYRGKDPKSTQELVNTLCDILIKRNVSSQIEDTESAIDFITEQLSIYEDRLESSEAKLREFREVYGAGASAGLEDISPVGATLTRINKELAELEAELVMASVECTPQHPRIKGITRRIESLKNKRNQYIKEIAQRAGIDSQAYIDIADSFPRQQEELARLTRGKAINERTYAMLLERLESAKITRSLDSSENKTKFRVIEPARLPFVPSKPNKVKLNFLGLFLGGIVGFGFIYLLEYTDPSFKSAEELKDFSGLPVLGSTSKIITKDDLKQGKSLAKKIFFVIAAVIIIAIVIILVGKIGPYKSLFG